MSDKEIICYEGSPNDAVSAHPVDYIKASCIIDGHMHINSGSCTPLPLLYAQVSPGLGQKPIIRKREALEAGLGVLGFKEGVEVQNESTASIADRAVNDNKILYQLVTNSHDFENPDRFEDIYENKTPVISPMIVAMMDMEYAHIAGYKGLPIYRTDKKGLFYFRRKSGSRMEQCEEHEDIRVCLAHEFDNSDTLKLERWQVQHSETKASAAKYPFKLIPLFFYDPRRWRLAAGKESLKSLEYGPWDEPFREIATETNPGIFGGFKMYPPLGHKPFDPLCDFLPEFYDRCESEKIPILTHCSPGGMCTHDAPFYIEFEGYHYRRIYDGKVAQQNKLIKIHADRKRPFPPPGPFAELSDSMIKKHRRIIDDKLYDPDMNHFFKNYVHPEEWRKVLKHFPELRLCLAHFGGDEWRRGRLEKWSSDQLPSEWIESIIDLTKEYPHVYTDISCFNLGNTMEKGNGEVRDSFGNFLCSLDDKRYSHLKHKIIFGTDWYLTLITRKRGGKYGQYCKEIKKFLDSIDRTFWLRFALINPWEFYGFKEQTKLENMRKKFEEEEANEKAVDSNFKSLLKVTGEVNKIKDQLNKFDLLQKNK